MARHQRKALVFISLVFFLTLTSALLLALSPAPLRPAAVSSLFAAQDNYVPDSMDSIFNTDTPVPAGRWNSILIHCSSTWSGNASTLATAEGLGDHFVIGNGDGATDGEIEIGSRWNLQQSALPPAGVQSIDGKCISICLVGDFRTGRPTATQVRRVEQLVQTLRSHAGIATNSVWTMGKNFPDAEFRAALAEK